METLSKTVVEQSRIIKEMRDLLLHVWGADDMAEFKGVFSGDDRGKSGQEHNLRQEVFALAMEEARRRIAARQAHREMLTEISHVVAEQEEQQD